MEDFCLSGQADGDLRLRFCTLRSYLVSFFPLSPDFHRPERHPSASGVIAPPMQWTHQERLNEGGGGVLELSELLGVTGAAELRRRVAAVQTNTWLIGRL